MLYSPRVMDTQLDTCSWPELSILRLIIRCSAFGLALGENSLSRRADDIPRFTGFRSAVRAELGRQESRRMWQPGSVESRIWAA